MSVSTPIRLAVVTGGHAFDVPAFHSLFRSLPGVDAYVQDLDNLAADAGGALGTYDAFCFYNMHRTPPEGRALEALSRLGTTEQGIVVLHHGVLAFAGWPVWDQVVGIPDRTLESYSHGERLPLQVTRADHPITRGITPWVIVDETYRMAGADEPAGNTLLVTTTHPQSMPSIAWTREHARARVFCLVLGHDAEAYADAGFRTLLARGIAWSARRF